MLSQLLKLIFSSPKTPKKKMSWSDDILILFFVFVLAAWFG